MRSQWYARFFNPMKSPNGQLRGYTVKHPKPAKKWFHRSRAMVEVNLNIPGKTYVKPENK